MENSININSSKYGLSFEKENIDKRSIKKESLKRLSKNWHKALFITGVKLFFMIINFILNFTVFFLTNEGNILFNYFPKNFLDLFNSLKYGNRSTIIIFFQSFSLLLNLILIPLNYGILRWFYSLVKNKKADISIIFYYYKKPKRFFKTFLFKLTIIYRFLFLGMIFIFPGLSLFLMSCVQMQIVSSNRKLLFSFAIIGMAIFLICGIFFFIRFAAKYFLMSFLQVTNDEGIVINTKKSVKIMNENEDYFGKIFFSFFMLLPLQIFVIPIFFIFPYTTSIMFVGINQKLKKNNP